MNVPAEVPLVVLLLAVVGVELVLQQMPLVVIADPPLLVMVPPDVADVCVTDEIAWVVIAGIVDACVVLKLTSSPYAVPMLLVA